VREDAVVLKLRRRVRDHIARHEVLRPGERVLLMLSGGADSMAMLALVRAVDPDLRLGLRLRALHVDYGLRGADSARDRRIVERACAEAGVPLDVLLLEAGVRGPNFQARAREVRFARAFALAAQHGCGAVATAHNRDDQAETILYRLAKYASPQALAGMRPREAGAPERADLARPLLCLGAAEVRDYCRRAAVEFGEDVSNAQPLYARNVVRHEVLPRLAELNPRLAETLAASAEIAAAEREVLEAAAAAALERVELTPEDDEIAALDLAALGHEPGALRMLCLRALVTRARGAGTLVERHEVESLERLAARRDDAGSVDLRGGWQVVRGGGRLRLRRRAPGHTCPPATLRVRPAAAARVRFCGGSYLATLDDGPRWPRERLGRQSGPAPPPGPPSSSGPPPPARCLEACAGLAGAPTRVELRHPGRGDRFTPFGMEHETTVARFLAAARVPAAARRRAVVLAVDGRVAWVGYGGPAGERRGRVARAFGVTESTVCTLHVVEEEG
jgi:tRNA(Ile)-lysidine synthase